MNRAASLALVAAALVLPQCGGKNANRRVLRVGSKNFGENIVVAEIYAQALERGGFSVERRFDLGSTQIATEAMVRGDIDLYPEYTGTGLIDVLHLAPMRNARALYEAVKRGYASRYRIAWLDPSPGNDSQGLAVTRAISRKYGLTTLSQCAKLAPQFDLAAIPEFVSRPDALPGLQQFYGGFRFRDVKTYAIGLQYDAVLRGAAQVAVSFTTDSQIETDALVLLDDDKHFWPSYNIAPLVRTAVLRSNERIAFLLDPPTARLTTQALRGFNVAYNVQKTDPALIAAHFLSGKNV